MLERTERDRLSLGIDLSVALLPVCIWSVWLYGERAAFLILLTGFFAFLFEYPVQVFLYHQPLQNSFSGFAFLSGVLAAFLLPVSAPLWFAPLAAAFVTVFRSLRFYFCHRPLNAAVASAAALLALFPSFMTRYTEPFAYFPAFKITLEERMVEQYRCLSPIDLLMKGDIYEDGIYAQIYGFASGTLGGVAVLCMTFGFCWLLARRIVRVNATGAYLITLILCSIAAAPEQVQLLNYAWLYLLAGGVPFVTFFAMNDYATTPMPQYFSAQAIFGVLAGLLTFAFRMLSVGILGDYLAILLADLATPWLEKLTEPKPYYALPRRKKAEIPAAEAPAEE